MNDCEYASILSFIMGWHYGKHEDKNFTGTRLLNEDNECAFLIVGCEEEFNPAECWESAGVWIKWLTNHGCQIYFQYAQTFYYVMIEHVGIEHEGVGATPLCALKSASEKFASELTEDNIYER